MPSAFIRGRFAHSASTESSRLVPSRVKTAMMSPTSRKGPRMARMAADQRRQGPSFIRGEYSVAPDRLRPSELGRAGNFRCGPLNAGGPIRLWSSQVRGIYEL